MAKLQKILLVCLLVCALCNIVLSIYFVRTRKPQFKVLYSVHTNVVCNVVSNYVVGSRNSTTNILSNNNQDLFSKPVYLSYHYSLLDNIPFATIGSVNYTINDPFAGDFILHIYQDQIILSDGRIIYNSSLYKGINSL